MPLSGKPGGYRKFAWTAMIVLAFLNIDTIFSGGIIPLLIGAAFLWIPAALADKLAGKDE